MGGVGVGVGWLSVWVDGWLGWVAGWVVGRIWKKEDIRITGEFIEVNVFPKVQHKLSEVLKREKGYSQLMSLLDTLGEHKEDSE